MVDVFKPADDTFSMCVEFVVFDVCGVVKKSGHYIFVSISKFAHLNRWFHLVAYKHFPLFLCFIVREKMFQVVLSLWKGVWFITKISLLVMILEVLSINIIAVKAFLWLSNIFIWLVFFLVRIQMWQILCIGHFWTVSLFHVLSFSWLHFHASLYRSYEKLIIVSSLFPSFLSFPTVVGENNSEFLALGAS